jgi:hypothetical protein
MSKKDKAFEEIWQARNEAIARTDKKLVEAIAQDINRFKDIPDEECQEPRIDRKMAWTIALLIIAVVALVCCSIAIHDKINPRTLIEHEDNYLQPKYTANCMKYTTDAMAPDEFGMICDRSNETK